MVGNATDHAKARAIPDDQIPVIDISKLIQDRSNSQSLRAVADQIHTAAVTVGFFYVSGHGISEQRIGDARDAAISFFSLSSSIKQRVLVDTHQRGWMPVGMAKLEGATTHDLKEVFFYGPEIAADDPDLLSALPLVAENRWPDACHHELRLAIEPYYQAMCDVGKCLMSAIAVSFDQPPTCFEPYYEKPLARGQLVYYPEAQVKDTTEQRFGVAAHTDFGALTLLYQDDSGGLQVKTSAGEWIEAPPLSGTLVCNIGDLLQTWTANTFRSTVHRVINRSGHARYSMPVFFDPSSHALIDPSLLGHKAMVNQTIISAGEHISLRNSRNFKQYQRS